MSAQLTFWRRDVGEHGATAHLNKVAPSALTALVDEVRWMAQAGQPFTSDDVVARLPDTVRLCLERAPNATGAVFTKLAKNGVIERTGAMVMSSRPGARGRRITLWRKP